MPLWLFSSYISVHDKDKSRKGLGSTQFIKFNLILQVFQIINQTLNICPIFEHVKKHVLRLYLAFFFTNSIFFSILKIPGFFTITFVWSVVSVSGVEHVSKVQNLVDVS